MSQRMRLLLGCIVASAISLLVAGGAGQGPVGDGDTFRGKIVYIVTKPKDAKSDSAYALLEKAEVKRLGDGFFLVGLIPAQGDSPVEKAAQGKRLWTPISDIVQITEFDGLDDARRYFEAAKDQPQDR